jgi:long-chain fatty acid transport protein
MQIKSLFLTLSLVLLSATAQATDGYFQHGYGVRSQATGGVAIALPQDALVIATNPAGIAWLDNRADLGATWFRPIRSAEIEGSVAPINQSYSGNDSQHFIIPEFGYVKKLNEHLQFGFVFYGNGGMNTDYKNGIRLFGNSRAGVDLTQAFLSPALVWKINPKQAVGIALNLAYQRFEAKGLQNFANAQFSSSPNHVTNNGHDNSYGAGLNIGWMGEVSDQIRLGAHYQSKTYMSRFNDYKGLFANQGDFDIPESFGIGIAVKATPKLTIAADIQRINYSDVDAVGFSVANFFTAQLGADKGAGFGWQDTTIFKLGLLYDVNENLTLRAGYNHSDQPIPNNETLFNILAPGVVEDHVTLGATWKCDDKHELSVSYMHAFENKVNGRQSIPINFGGGDANLKMRQDSIGVAYTWLLN